MLFLFIGYIHIRMGKRDLKDIARFVLRQEVWREDPVSFAREVLNSTLEDHQKDICFSVRDYKRTSVASCNGIGKSYIAAVLALWWLVSHYDPKNPTVVLVTANNFKQIKKVVFKEIDRLYKEANKYLQEEFGFEGGLGGKISEGQNSAILEYDAQNYIIGISSDDPNAIQGNRGSHTLVIVDEASGLDEECFSAFKSVLATGKGRLLLIGNPMQASGSFYESFGESSTYNAIQISAFDTPNFKQLGLTQEDIENDIAWKSKLSAWSKISLRDIQKETIDKFKASNPEWTEGRCIKEGEKLGYEFWVEKVESKLPARFLIKPFFARETFEDCGFNNKHFLYMPRVLGRFPEETEATLIPLSWIETSFKNHDNDDLHIKNYTPDGKEEIIFGVDTGGGSGRDASVVAIRSGNKIINLLSWTKLNTRLFSEKIVDLYKTYNSGDMKVVSINIERDGIGKAIVDNLEAWDLPVREIVVGGSASGEVKTKKEKIEGQEQKDIFNRMRDRCWWNFRELLDSSKTENPILLFFNKDLKKQLQIMTWKMLPTNKIKVAGKDDIAPLLNGGSPDEATACVIAFAPTQKIDPIKVYGLNIFTIKK